MKIERYSRHVYAVQRYVDLTSPRYVSLMDPDTTTHPISCFGNVEMAKVVTVGLNPSIGEFDQKRRWPGVMDHTTLADRCAGYFVKGATPGPHGWFAPWTDALGHLGFGYENGSAVHLDLTPRATRFVSQLKDEAARALFLEMVERDLWIFFATLNLCRNAKLLLLAGTVTGKYYINEFLQRFAPDFGWSLDGAFNRAKHPGNGKTQWHQLSTYDRRIPVFFCSSSPSDTRNRDLLPKRILENADALKETIRAQTNGCSEVAPQ